MCVFYFYVNDNAPTIRAHLRYVSVCSLLGEGGWFQWSLKLLSSVNFHFGLNSIEWSEKSPMLQQASTINSNFLLLALNSVLFGARGKFSFRRVCILVLVRDPTSTFASLLKLWKVFAEMFFYFFFCFRCFWWRQREKSGSKQRCDQIFSSWAE